MLTKPKKCKVCKLSYIPNRPLETWCSYECALKLVEDAKVRKARKALKEGRIALKSRSDYIKLAQQQFNKFIRLRDGNTCISCGTTNPGIQYAAGHYRSTAAAPELRLNELNVHSQCNFQCNQMRSGNLIPYRVALIAKIGQDKVDWLEGKHEPVKYTIPELQSLIVEYKAKIKELTIA